MSWPCAVTPVVRDSDAVAVILLRPSYWRSFDEPLPHHSKGR